jgi:hypothetical protein
LKPKFKKGEKVMFLFNGEEKIGLIETVDTFFGHAGVEYDIWVDDEPCLYKHVGDLDILGVIE